MPACSFQVTWADLGADHQMRNTGFLGYAAQARFLFLAEYGFTRAEFEAL
jgi:hypothetical protein